MRTLCATLFVATFLGTSLLGAQPDSESDIIKAHAFVEHVFFEIELFRYEEAAEQYLWILRQLGAPLAEKERAIVLHHVRMLSLVMSPSDRAHLAIDRILQGVRVPAGVGDRLVYWWRQQDTLPATRNNERLEEHLARVMFATHKYGNADDVRGFDDRGEIYVRLGKPFRKRSIMLVAPVLVTHPYATRLPDNEIWVYRDVHDQAHYFFLRRTKNQPFKLGYAIDLVPTGLRTGRRKTRLLLAILEEIYAQLALEHAHYGRIYDAAADYLTLPTDSRPYLFAQRLVTQARTDEEQHHWSREKTVPVSFSNVRDHVEELEPALRWARFLTPEGVTRTELYWSLEPDALKSRRRFVNALKKEGHEPSKKSLLSVSVAQRRSDYVTQHLDSKRYLVTAETDDSFTPVTMMTRGDSTLFHLGIQWDLQWTKEDTNGELQPGAMLKVGSQVIDSLAALKSSGRELEMSDIKPLSLTVDPPIPYPFAYLSNATPLALYFELYHLTFGDDDRTHYTVEYIVSSSSEEQRTSVSSRYEGLSRIARERIVLNLDAWDTLGPLRVTLRATDDILGTSVERSITFEYVR